MTHHDMSTPTPDYGEPEWPDLIGSGDGLTVGLKFTPEQTITELRKELAHQTDMACQAHVCGGAKIEELQKEIASLRGERDCLNRELSAICRVADAHTADEACEVIRAMREAIRFADQLLDADGYEEDNIARAKLQPFIK